MKCLIFQKLLYICLMSIWLIACSVSFDLMPFAKGWLRSGICGKCFLLFPKKNSHQKKLRQTKCILFKIWRLKCTIIPKKAIWHLAIWQKWCFGLFYWNLLWRQILKRQVFARKLLIFSLLLLLSNLKYISNKCFLDKT